MKDLHDPKNWSNPETKEKYRYFDRKGNGIEDVLEWAKKMDEESYKRVAEDTLPSGHWVSTVWLGTDYSFRDDVPPLIFETMVFTNKKSLGTELDLRRYSNEDEALEGHKEMVEKWKNKINKYGRKTTTSY